MNWRTHIAVGMNSLWVAGLTDKLDESVIWLIPAAAVGSLLPDIDASDAKIHYAAGGVMGGFKGLFFGKYFHHRGIMHSLFMNVVLFIIAWFIFRDTQPLVPLVFGLSYLSHLIIDGFNTGVGYLYPFNLQRFALVPRFLRTPVKGPVDNLLFFAAIAGLALFFLSFSSQFFPSSFNL